MTTLQVTEIMPTERTWLVKGGEERNVWGERDVLVLRMNDNGIGLWLCRRCGRAYGPPPSDCIHIMAVKDSLCQEMEQA